MDLDYQIASPYLCRYSSEATQIDYLAAKDGDAVKLKKAPEKLGAFFDLCPSYQFYPGQLSTAGRAIIVAVISATVFPVSSATISPWQTVRVRPAFTTRPTARKRDPAAGASRFTLNSTLRTSDCAGIIVRAA